MKKLTKKIVAVVAACLMVVSMAISVSAADHIHYYSDNSWISQKYLTNHQVVTGYYNGQPVQWATCHITYDSEYNTPTCGCGATLPPILVRTIGEVHSLGHLH